MSSQTRYRPPVPPSSGSCRGRCVGAPVPRGPAGSPPRDLSGAPGAAAAGRGHPSSGCRAEKCLWDGSRFCDAFPCAMLR